MNAVIYARYSSDNQREESIEGQLRECKEFAEANDMIIVDTYIDRALSAKTDNRPEFQKMVKDSAKGAFELVIVWKLDRFARNRYDSAHYKAVLQKNGVKVVSATEKISQTPEGILLESLLEGMAEYYSAELAEKVTRGLTENALKCKYNGGTLPIGYAIDENQFFIIDPLTAPAVLDAFKHYAEGATMQQITDELNLRGVRTKKNTRITLNTVTRMLHNRRYIGEYKYSDITTPNGIPPIVPVDLFERVQDMMKANKKAPAKHKAEDEYLLTTKLFCGKCGEPMTGDGGTGKSGKVYNYYTCNGHRRKKCDKKRVAKEWIENLVVGELKHILSVDGFIDRVADLVMEYQTKTKDDSALRALEARQKEVERSITNLMTAIEQGIITPTTKSRLVELEADHERINKAIAKEVIKKPELERDQIVWFLERFRDGDTNDEAFRAFLVDTFLNSVYLYDDEKMILILNYSGKNNKVTLKAVENSVIKRSAPCSVFAPPSLPNGADLNIFVFFKDVIGTIINLRNKNSRG